MKNYIVVDIEATTSDVQAARIIELAIIVVRDGKIEYVFETLVNPEVHISENIQLLTGIKNTMVANAPKFYEISDRIWELIQDEIFISHKTDFDYLLLKKCFLEMGKELSLRTICTLKLSQKLFENLPSYTLGYLCNYLGFPCKDQHRASPDAHMLYELFKQLIPLLSSQTRNNIYLAEHKKFISKTPKLPGFIKITNNLHEVRYYSCENMFNWLQKHLALSWQNKEYVNSVKNIDFCSTGSFMASCLQSPIKKHPRYVIYQFSNRNGLMQIAWGKVQKNKTALLYFDDRDSCLEKYELIREELSKVQYFLIKGDDKTHIVKKNNLLNEVLSKYIPRNESLLFRSFHKLHNKYIYVHIKGQKYYAIFESDKTIKKKCDLPLINYEKLTPKPYMQFVKAWQVIRNQRLKTDLIYNF